MSPTGRARGAECLPEGHPPRPQLPGLAAECVSVQVCRRSRSVLLDVSEGVHVGDKGDSQAITALWVCMGISPPNSDGGSHGGVLKLYGH